MTTPMTDNARIDADAKHISWNDLRAAIGRNGDPIDFTGLEVWNAVCSILATRRSIQEQPEAVALADVERVMTERADYFDRTKGQWTREDTARSYRSTLADLLKLASAPPPIAGAGWKQGMEEAAEIVTKYALDEAQGGMKTILAQKMAKSIRNRIVAASPVPDNTDARGAQVSVRDAGGLREELRLLATAQPLSGERSTYSDGFANGLFHAIERLDRALDPVKAPKP